MRSGISGLPAALLQELERFYKCSLRGPNAAAIIAAGGAKLSEHLDVLEALWYVQAFKERYFDHWYMEIRKLHAAQVSNCN